MPRYACASCGRETDYAGPLPALYPFCSSRCRWVDLGRWLKGDYTLDRELSPEELAALPPEELRRLTGRPADTPPAP